MQRTFPFLSIMPPPKDAPAWLVRDKKMNSGRAIAVSIGSGKHYLIAGQLRISTGRLSQLIHGDDIPDWFVRPFCALTGSNLLKQVLDAEAKRYGETETKLIRRLANELRKSA